MKNKYQIFVSSTFCDLKNERQAILRAILELDQIPSGMELFPASDDNAWTKIKDEINNSDCYTVIVGGRYGSLDESGISYTEKEYDYAMTIGKPIIAFLHRKPEKLPRYKTEDDKSAWEKLNAFRKKIEEKHTCVYWTNPDNLKAEVIRGLADAITRMPGTGWVRSDKALTDETANEILKLKKIIKDLENQLQTHSNSPPLNTEDLLQGDDPITIPFAFTARFPDDYSYPEDVDKIHESEIILSLNEIFSAVGPCMLNKISHYKLRDVFNEFFLEQMQDQSKTIKEAKSMNLMDHNFADKIIDTCILQFDALGLIKENQNSRSGRNSVTYWKLTLNGKNILTKLRVLRRNNS